MSTVPMSPASTSAGDHVRAEIDRHFAGAGSVREEQHMRSHVGDCADCRTYYERHLIVAQLDPKALSSQERLRRGLGLARPWRLSLLPTLAGATAVLALMLVMKAPRDPSSGFTARGPAPGGAELLVYRVSAEKSVEPARVEGAISVGDELAFAYRTPADKRQLMIYGVDEHRHVYWYYPAWTDAAANPRSVAALPGPDVHELSEAVRHDLDGGHLRLVALFSDEALTVREVEAAVARDPSATPPGTVASSVELEVRR